MSGAVERDLLHLSPVQQIDTGSRHPAPAPGVALCLSGGGYRAMLFHLGSIWRLCELHYLGKLDRISSVSGGSITAAMLGLKWERLKLEGFRADSLVREVATPLRKLARLTIDWPAVLTGMVPLVAAGTRIARAYRRALFGCATLQKLPDSPRFVINATNVQSGVLWRFMKPYMRDYRVGEVKSPRIRLADAVAASSAFPPFLSPLPMTLDPTSFTPRSGKDLQRTPFTSRIVLTDGGVYDNLGLETAWKRYDTILVSDAGGQMMPKERPKGDWCRHILRVLWLIDNQVRSLRKRQVIQSFKLREQFPESDMAPEGLLLRLLARKGTYWGIRSHIKDYGLATALPCPPEATLELAEVRTRLARLDEVTQERLINWGYAICDAAMRKHVDPALPRPDGFPYARGVM